MNPSDGKSNTHMAVTDVFSEHSRLDSSLIFDTI